MDTAANNLSSRDMCMMRAEMVILFPKPLEYFNYYKPRSEIEGSPFLQLF
jgi:hypothetical protein